MDPLHPIIPVAPNIPPVAPTPLIGRVNRDAGRRTPDEQRRGRRQPASGPNPPMGDEHDGDDDSGLHINVTA